MARMSPALLCLALAAGAARAQEPASRPFEPGRFAFAAPASARVEQRVGSGVSDTHIELRYGLYLDGTTYAWWSHYAAGVPASAREYVDMLTELGVSDFRVVEPPKRTEFAGYPAWTLTRSYSIKRRRQPAEIHVTESYLAIQRRWGYTVVSYTDDSEFFAQDRARYEAFLGGLKLLPEPPGGPVLLLVGALGALVLLILAGRRAWRRRRAPTA